MARGAAQARRKRTKAEAARRRRRAQTSVPARSTEKALFFTRLRAQAKWVFVFLALVFAVGFVVFGVGSGGGVGLGDLFSSDPTQSAVSEGGARERIKKNPNNAQAYRDLATALQAKGDLNGAISALRQFTRLRPTNTDGLAELAGLHTSLGARFQNEITEIQIESQDNSFISAINSDAARFGAENSLFKAVTDYDTSRLSDLFTKQQTSYTKAEGIYKRIVRLTPTDATAQLNLGQIAQTAGDTETAITAYKQFIKLAPDDPTTSLVRQQIKALRQAASQPVQPG